MAERKKVKKTAKKKAAKRRPAKKTKSTESDELGQVKITVSIPKEYAERLKQISEKIGKSLKTVQRRAMMVGIKRTKAKKKTTWTLSI